MQEEINEILDKLYLNFEKAGLTAPEYSDLRDYITNLQEENEYNNYCNEELRKKITNLEYKIERLEEELQQEKKDFKEANDYCFELKDYKSRNEKAIEYIKRHIQPDSFEGYLDSYEIKKTLNILQGVDKE